MRTLCPSLLSGTLQQTFWYKIILVLGRCSSVTATTETMRRINAHLPVSYRKSLALLERPSQILSSNLFWRENGLRASWRRMCVILKSLWLVYLTCCLSITRLRTHSPVFSGKAALNARTAACHRVRGANAVPAAFTVLSSSCELTRSTSASSCPGKSLSAGHAIYRTSNLPRNLQLHANAKSCLNSVWQDRRVQDSQRAGAEPWFYPGNLLFSGTISSLSWTRLLAFMVRSCTRRVWWEWRTVAFLLICWRLKPSWRSRRWTPSLPGGPVMRFWSRLHLPLFAAFRTWWRSWRCARVMIWWVFTNNSPTSMWPDFRSNCKRSQP